MKSINFLISGFLTLFLTACSASDGWVKVQGNKFIDPQGEELIFRGLCFSDPVKLVREGQWNERYFAEARHWGANVVRFAVHPANLNSMGWDETFKAMDQGIEWAGKHDMYVIMDWHSIGNLKEEKFTSPMYNTTREETFRFWRTVAQRYKDQPTVALYELYNEPTVTAPGVGDCSWTQWKELQEQIIDTVRTYNPHAVCLCAGFNWAYDLTPVAKEPVNRPNVAYVSHPYPMKRSQPWEEQWEKDFGYVADTYPVICTEIGFCLQEEPGAHIPVMSTEVYGEHITRYFEKKGISFTVWCFDTSWAPMLISDWDFTPTTQGRFFKTYLQGKAHPEIARTQGNPYLPLWEHIPDGEPYVFEDPDKPGSKRVYIYGSHDTERTMYCGRDQVVWSAPVDSLWNWRYDGVILCLTKDRDGRDLNENGQGDVLYAPDVCCVTNADGTKTYYLYPNDMGFRRNNLVARSSRPDGPFEVINWSQDNPTATEGIMGFDPAVFADEDGRIYGYWGFSKSYGAELDPGTMATVKPGTSIVEDMLSNLNQEGDFRFFEASSIRKIEDKYVFVYSRWSADGEFGLPGTNYTLAYAYGDHPLGPWTYGGTLIDGRARDINEKGETIASASPTGNTHGSICEINGQWYVFYHRQTGLNEYSRQAMVAPVTVCVEKGPGGKVSISEGEYTSEGFAMEGLNPLEPHSAGIACWYTGGPYPEPGYGTEDRFEAPYSLRNNTNRIVNIMDGSIVGYKYFNFDGTHGRKDVRLSVRLVPAGVDGVITVWADRPWASQGGKELGTIGLTADMPASSMERTVSLPGLEELKGKHALYFTFSSPVKGKSVCSLESLVFD